MTTFELGQFNAICDRCGFAYKARQLKLEWTGLRVCHGTGTNDCWEVRHPQDMLRGVKDRQAPPWTRPGGEDIELAVGDVTPGDL